MISRFKSIFKKKERKIVYFEHTKQMYVLPNIPLLEYNTWYNFSCNLRYTIIERKRISKIINSVINIDCLSNIIYEYFDEKYDLRMCILTYENRFSRIIFKYASDKPNYADQSKIVTPLKSSLHFDMRELSHLEYMKLLIKDNESKRINPEPFNVKSEWLNLKNLISNNYNKTNFCYEYVEMKMHERYNMDLFLKEYLYVHIHDKLTGYIEIENGASKYIEQYEYGNIPELQKFIKELSMIIHKNIKI